ncbi:MAG: hypothetical protein LIO62_04750 [Clostridiales bacterium]|nr:hypothetical protein [Clostridiales bacterium]
MKIIYISGAPRCGKTILANKIAKEYSNVSVLSLDSLSKSVRFVFPNFKLYTEKIAVEPDTNKDKFLKLLQIYVSNFFADFPNLTLLIEGCHFTPSEILSVYPNAKVICLGINTSISDALEAVNTSDWMRSLDENTRLEYAKKIFDYSNKARSLANDKYLYFDKSKIDFNDIKNYLD